MNSIRMLPNSYKNTTLFGKTSATLVLISVSLYKSQNNNLVSWKTAIRTPRDRQTASNALKRDYTTTALTDAPALVKQIARY